MKETHPPVICDFNIPPSDPCEGQRFGILDKPEGEWSEHPNGVAEWCQSKWNYTDPVTGMVVYNQEEHKAYLFNGEDWVDID